MPPLGESIVSKWLAQTQAERTRAESELHAGSSAAPRRMTPAEITTLFGALGNIVTALRDADPADKAEVYRQLGLRLTYHPEARTVHAETDLSAHRGPMGRVRGSTRTDAHLGLRVVGAIPIG